MESNANPVDDAENTQQASGGRSLVLTTPTGIRLELYEIPLSQDEQHVEEESEETYAPFDASFPFLSLLLPQNSTQRPSSPEPPQSGSNVSVDNGDLIPCENCEEMVPFDRYSDHIERCVYHANRQATGAMFRELFRMPEPIQRPHSNPMAWTDRVRQLHPVFFNQSDTPLSLLDRTLSHVGLSLLQFVNPENEYEFNMRIAELMGGNVPHGIENKNAATTLEFDIPADTICTICQEDLKAKGQPVRKTKCGHMFCEACLFKWWDAHNTCPNCLQKVDQASTLSSSSGHSE